MRTKRLAIPMMMLVLAATFTGCATSRDMDRVQLQQQMLESRVAQALQDAQDARMAADAARVQANQAIARAESVEQAALERERIAQEQAAQRSEAAFSRSMMK